MSVRFTILHSWGTSLNFHELSIVVESGITRAFIYTNVPTIIHPFSSFSLHYLRDNTRINKGGRVSLSVPQCSQNSMHLSFMKLSISRVLSDTRNKFVYPALVYFLILLIRVIIQSLWHSTGSMKYQANNLFIVLLFLLPYMNGFLIIKM